GTSPRAASPLQGWAHPQPRPLRVALHGRPPEAAALRGRPSLRRQAWSRGPQPPSRGRTQRPGGAGSAGTLVSRSPAQRIARSNTLTIQAGSPGALVASLRSPLGFLLLAVGVDD